MSACSLALDYRSAKEKKRERPLKKLLEWLMEHVSEAIVGTPHTTEAIALNLQPGLTVCSRLTQHLGITHLSAPKRLLPKSPRGRGNWKKRYTGPDGAHLAQI